MSRDPYSSNTYKYTLAIMLFNESEMISMIDSKQNRSLQSAVETTSRKRAVPLTVAALSLVDIRTLGVNVKSQFV